MICCRKQSEQIQDIYKNEKEMQKMTAAMLSYATRISNKKNCGPGQEQKCSKCDLISVLVNQYRPPSYGLMATTPPDVLILNQIPEHNFLSGQRRGISFASSFSCCPPSDDYQAALMTPITLTSFAYGGVHVAPTISLELTWDGSSRGKLEQRPLTTPGLDQDKPSHTDSNCSLGCKDIPALSSYSSLLFYFGVTRILRGCQIRRHGVCVRDSTPRFTLHLKQICKTFFVCNLRPYEQWRGFTFWLRVGQPLVLYASKSNQKQAGENQENMKMNGRYPKRITEFLYYNLW